MDDPWHRVFLSRSESSLIGLNRLALAKVAIRDSSEIDSFAGFLIRLCSEDLMEPRVSLIGHELLVQDCEGGGKNGEKEGADGDSEVAEKGFRFMKGSISMKFCTEWRSFRRSAVNKWLAEALRRSTPSEAFAMWD